MPRGAFTLVEILIVVVILGILAAIVMPQFANAANDTSATTTFSELQKIRRHVGVFKARNGDALPAVVEGDGTWGELVSRDHFLSPPTNAWVGAEAGRVVKFGTGPDTAFQTAYGWIYNPASGEVWAASFDAQDVPLPRN
ncbi:MAG: type II secretion system protein [Phycisphaerales bacterium]